MSGEIRAIALTRKKRAAMESIARAEITEAAGIVGDARGKIRDRQVTLLFEDDWSAACRALGRALPWTTRRANVLIGNMAVPSRAGAKLRVGGVLLEVTEETAPCQVMERAAAGLRKALTPGWRGGVCCKVLEGGQIAIGDAVTTVS